MAKIVTGYSILSGTIRRGATFAEQCFRVESGAANLDCH